MIDPSTTTSAPAALWFLVPAGLSAAAVGWFTRSLIVLSDQADEAARDATGFEALRRARLRQQSATYRGFAPLIDELARLRRGDSPKLQAIRNDLLASATPVPWTAAEFLAARQIESVAAGLGGALFGLLYFDDALAAVLLAGLAAWGYQWLMVNELATHAAARLRAVKKRLPFAVDLMALMMEAGASFQEAITVVVHEDRGSALADELGQVLNEIKLGRARREALEALKNRLPDGDVAELVLAVVKGEELGTPLSEILRTQSQQMLSKRSQWIEAASGEAQVKIVFPGMIIMIACLLIIAAPFALAFLYSNR